MRYTRYEYKKSSRLKFLCSVAFIIGISIGGGLYMSNLIFDGKEIKHDNKAGIEQLSDKSDSNKIENIIALQCGYYSKEDNAKELLTSIGKYCKPFIVEDDGKYRVVAGIYKETDGLKKIEEFKANNIDVAKVNLNLRDNTIENKKIMEIIEGFLTIINKLQENEVKSIKTEEFKSWSNKIINDDNSAKTKKLDDLNNYISSLPEEIDKNNNSSNMQQLYKLIKN